MKKMKKYIIKRSGQDSQTNHNIINNDNNNTTTSSSFSSQDQVLFQWCVVCGKLPDRCPCPQGRSDVLTTFVTRAEFAIKMYVMSEMEKDPQMSTEELESRIAGYRAKHGDLPI